MNCCRQRFFQTVVFGTLSVLLAVPAFGRATTSGSAGVGLTGVLQGVSVEAFSAPERPLAAGADVGPVRLQSLMAVPAHFTTIRVSAKFVPQQSGSLHRGGGEVKVFAQPARDNWPVSRMDQVDVQRLVHPDRLAGGAPSGTVKILVQAL
jgi:hypothetical protein